MLILPWKFLFLCILTLGSMIAMSASSWLMAWMGLEINMLALLALLMSNTSARNSEATLKYFLVQALASTILISSAFSASAMFSFLSSLSFFSDFILISLIVKLGGAPFHNWIPQIVEGLSWINNMIVLTWQKVAPFILISSCLETKFATFIFSSSIMLSTLVGSILGLSQTSIRKIVAFSSINHIGWMLASIGNKLTTWLVYFTIYSLMLVTLMTLIMKSNLTSISNSSFSIKNTSYLPFFVSIISFGGLPPFLGFAPKWFVISQLTLDSISITLVLVMSSLIALYFYLRVAFSSLLFKSPLSQKFMMKSNSGVMALMINSLGLLLIPILFLY